MHFYWLSLIATETSLNIAANFHSEWYTLCLKKRINFETLELEIIRIDLDDIW